MSGRVVARLLPFSILVCFLLAAPILPAEAGDPGLHLELDRESHRLRARDLGETGERPALELSVAVGSPSHPTPAGRFPIHRVILHPGWTPAEAAQRAGARRVAPSLLTPMGVAKIPFAEGGEIALHGGGDPLLLGKEVSSGCVRLEDAALLRLLAWMEERGALDEPVRRPDGEVHRRARRPMAIEVR